MDRNRGLGVSQILMHYMVREDIFCLREGVVLKSKHPCR